MRRWIHSLFRKIVGAVLVLAVMAALPTGWLYDLWAGTGTEQGQRPGEGVEQLRRREDLERVFLARTPVTVSGGKLAACPLVRLRDVEAAGESVHRSYGGRSVFVPEYISTDDPIPVWRRLAQGAIGGFYNRYYLMELGDRSWLCVYFDDYLALTGTDSYATGYVRYGTTEERRMLNRMTEDYDVDPVYVLDMYRHGKVLWMLDIAIRFGVLIAAAVAAETVRKRWGKRGDTDE